ncbi:MAG: FliO/MopB family protein [Candidatus Kapaibacterium sp.]
MDGTIFKAFVTLIGCIAFLWAVLWLVKRKTSGGQVGTQELRIRIIARQALSGKASIMVVEVGEKVMTLGVTEHSVTILNSVADPESGAGDSRRSRVAAPTFGPMASYPPTAPPEQYGLPRPVASSTSPSIPLQDLSIRGYLRTLFRRG